MSLITFTTDFGLNDHYVGTMKGVVLNIDPAAQMVDICNNVQSFDLLDGALTIAQSYSYFPPNTIHLVVVDPGVGTARRPIVARAGQHLFVAPDNGVLSFVYEREERISVRHITAEHHFLQPVSNTFQGRDIFAPVAAYLSKGVAPEKFGDEITDFVRFSVPRPQRAAEKTIKAVVLKVDKFGNLVTNIRPEDLPPEFERNTPAFVLRVGKAQVTKLSGTFAQGGPGEVFAVFGSMGFMEIATNRGAAARVVEAGKGSEVTIQL
jgi:S-adenosylmethionine hydrolase